MIPLYSEQVIKNKSKNFSTFRNTTIDENEYSSNNGVFSGYSNFVCKTPRLENLQPQKETIQKLTINSDSTVTTLRRKTLIPQIEPFRKYNVPDLVLEIIFSNLNKKDLSNSMRVCRRFYLIGAKCNHWKTIDMAEKRLNEFTLAAILQRNVISLRISDTKVDTTQRIPEKKLFSIASTTKNRLQYLDASRSSLDYLQFVLLLTPTTNLTCLSLEGHTLSDSIARLIAKNINLTKLDLSMSRGLTVNGSFVITKFCRKLEEINVSWCELDRESSYYFFNCSPPTLRKLNVAGAHRHMAVVDEYIRLLSIACPLLTDLDISDNNDVTQEIIPIILNNFPQLTTFSCSRCYGIDPNALVNLNNSHVKVLNIYGCITDSNLDLFKSLCNTIEINKHIFNFTAKPTMTNNPSNRIWGQFLEP